jgi:hypothetical protein
MKPGDWVRFWTKNWPADVRSIGFSTDKPGEFEDVTGRGLYLGRGRIVRVRENGALLIREERSERLVEVAPGERVEPLAIEYHALTLGDLRKFLEEFKDAPDDTAINVSLPVEFNCDDERLGLEERHPERHEPNSFEDVSACALSFIAIEENSGEIVDGYIPPEEREPGEEWFFSIAIMPNGKEAHDALRGDGHE